LWLGECTESVGSGVPETRSDAGSHRGIGIALVVACWDGVVILESCAREGSEEAMMDMNSATQDAGSAWEIEPGWDVVASDGEKVGDVEEVQPTYLVVGKGLIFHSERYIPVSAIVTVEQERIYLNVTKDELEAQGWDTVPASATIYDQLSTSSPDDTATTDQPRPARS